MPPIRRPAPCTVPREHDDPAAGGEKGMYDRIIAHKSGSLEIPGASKECNDFVNKLMHQDEKKRMTAAKLAKHSWFKNSAVDFNALNRGEVPAPFTDIVAKNNEAVYQGKMGAGESKSSRGANKVASVPYLGDPEWFESF